MAKPEYSALIQDVPGTHGDEAQKQPKTRRSRCIPRTYLLVSLLVAANIFQSVLIFSARGEEQMPSEYARIEPLATKWHRFWWNTAYSRDNHTESDSLWDAILPSHGLVAVDRDWAVQQQWPDSMYLPNDHNKGVYLLEAYHQLHCLRILRKTFWEAIEHRPFTYHPSSHMEHCFDTLRQYVQCNADNTPLYTFGDNTAGDGQIHRCRDWEQLRDFATENTACYKDSVEEIPLGDHFGYCDNGTDGLLDFPRIS